MCSMQRNDGQDGAGRSRLFLEHVKLVIINIAQETWIGKWRHAYKIGENSCTGLMAFYIILVELRVRVWSSKTE